MGSIWLEATFTDAEGSFVVDERIYSVPALLRTAYWFTDRAYVFITFENEQSLRVHLKPKAPSLETPQRKNIGELAGEFANSLLDHQLRESIEERTGKIRELIIAKAFAEAGLLEEEPPGSPNDPVADLTADNLASE